MGFHEVVNAYACGFFTYGEAVFAARQLDPYDRPIALRRIERILHDRSRENAKFIRLAHYGRIAAAARIRA